MKQYSSWQALFLSFWSASLYRDVAENWQGVGYLHLLFVVCLTIFFIALQTQVVVVPRAEQIADSVLSQMPNVTIEKGKLSIDKASPYVLTEPKSGQPIITIDTRPKPVSLEESKSVFLVTSEAIYARKQPVRSYPGQNNNQFSLKTDGQKSPQLTSEQGAIERFDISSVDHLQIDVNSGKLFLHSFFRWLGVLLFVTWLPFAFLFVVLQTLVYALLGKLFSSLASVDLSYSTLVRLSAVTLTPVLLLDSLIKVSGVSLTYWPWLSVLLALGYLYFAVIANASEQKQPPAEKQPPVSA